MRRNSPTGLALAVIAASAATLAACMTPTGYEERTGHEDYGYADKEVGDREYSIVVVGNPKTSLERVQAIARLRAARLTLEKGFQRFTIIHDKSGVFVDPKTLYLHLPPGAVLPLAPIGVYGSPKATAVLIIKVMSEEEGRARGALDAAEVERKAAAEVE